MTAPKRDAPGCIFCIAAASENVRETLTVFRTGDAVVMLNRYPYTNGHLMVAPVAHESRLYDSTDRSLRALIRLTADAQRVLSDVYHPDGFNVGMNFGTVAGAAIGALIGAFRRQRPKPRHARAAEAANAIVVAVAARSEREAELLGQLLAGQGGRDVRIESPGA